METQTYSTLIKSGSGASVAATADIYSADGQISINNQVSAADTLEEHLSVDVSTLEAWYMWSDKEITVQPKSGGLATSDGPFTLPAKKALWWNTGRVETNPLTDDFDQLDFTNAGADAANIKCGFLVNAAV